MGHKEGYCSLAFRWNANRRKSAIRSVTIMEVGSGRGRNIDVLINQTRMRMMVDTGADITIVSSRLWQQMAEPVLKPSTITARTASGEQLYLLGEFTAEIKPAQQRKDCVIRVASENLSLFGRDAMDIFNLWNVPLETVCNQLSLVSMSSNYFKDFEDLFLDEPGCCKKGRIQLVLKEGAIPVFRPKRPVAYAMMAAVNGELDRLEREGIITP